MQKVHHYHLVFYLFAAAAGGRVLPKARAFAPCLDSLFFSDVIYVHIYNIACDGMVMYEYDVLMEILVLGNKLRASII